MKNPLFPFAILLGFVQLCRGDEPKAMKPADIKKFAATPEPKEIPEDLRKPGVFDDEYPLPQNKETAEKNRRELLAWWKKQTVDAFEATSDPKAPWAEKAKVAIKAVTAAKAAVNLRDSIVLDEAVEGCRQAMLAECTDPLIRYYTFHWLGVDGQAEQGAPEEIAAFIDVLLKGEKYPVALKARAAWDTALRFEKSTKTNELAPKYYDQFWTHFVELAKSKDRFDQDLTVELGRKVEQQYVTLGQKRQDGHAAVMKALDMAKVDDWVRQTVEGNYKFFSALDVKKNNDDDSRKLLKERIASARKAYQLAWEAKKEMPEAATMMISVCIEEGSTREEMDAWFVKAMTADPDNYTACQLKLSFLSPANKGNVKVMIGFGRQCFRTMNHYAALGYILDEAHRIAKVGNDIEYYAKPEPWADLREVYETRLKLFPTDRYARTRYGAICLTAGEGPGAFQHLSAVKANPWPGIMRQFDNALTQAEELAQEQLAKP